ncbi:hypothetical protein ASPVEDRAFT_86678 [Aspergillus versicolor CBS 583.65]|uniref:Zn(2)-C6 fungal-type domain-containing protein n=1 Tax=Aspergillus versicolor CBS 583.65 TaxID=1036611 RepID=A0A1L9PV28_ASPVE|nr:uncharacterized protein ASPVEDRAFT_86678 [Aspergillus versicolor CBS 583.65]OJJ05323.1 hypothetical protein ASPVEDRAFT_86678 [Aspergillus versicolor CBS 583.65]
MPTDGGTKFTRRACDSCYKRKIKCDTAVPQCKGCSDHDVPCTFNRVQRRRKPKINRQPRKLTELSERLSRIEKLLVEHSTQNPSFIPHTPQMESSLSAIVGDKPQLSYLMHVWLNDREACRIILPTVPTLLPGIRKWAQARAGLTVSGDNLGLTLASRQRGQSRESSAALSSLPRHIFELPDWWAVRLYFDAYRKSPLMRVFPVIEAKLFEDTISAVYWPQQSGLRKVQASSRTCILAFLSFVARLGLTNLPAVDHGRLASKSQHFMTQIHQESASLDAAQAATILASLAPLTHALYELLSGRLSAVNYFLSIATRQLMLLGANMGPDRVSSYRCLPAHWPSTYNNGRNCDLTLPHGYLDRVFADPEKDDNAYDGPVFPLDLRLSLIKSKVYSRLYSVKAREQSDADLLKAIRELDEALEEWRLSIPPDWRPRMSSAAQKSDHGVSIRSIMLHLNYYLCIIAIHQATIQCKASGKGHRLEGGLSSSLALSVQASRSTLHHLKRAENMLVSWAFWVLSFYAMAALLTVFCNILQDPLGSCSGDDAMLLKVATSIMERILSSNISATDASNARVVADFVAELRLLAENYSRRARHETDMDRIY